MINVKEINVTTGEEIKREMTPEELDQWQADQAETEAKEAEQTAKEAAKTAAQEKLAGLGLTAEEIAAITGA